VNVKDQVYNGEDAWKLVSGADKVYVASGKNIIEFDPVNDDKEEILKKITGRTGNLRAPALKRGNEFFVGFNTDMYARL
jgi:hypothetical protein